MIKKGFTFLTSNGYQCQVLFFIKEEGKFILNNKNIKVMCIVSGEFGKVTEFYYYTHIHFQ